MYDNQSQVAAIVPDLAQISRLGPLDVVVTAPGDTDDFVSRYFWPANGGEEDPVTGSIHTSFAPYWANNFGKNTLTALQISKRTGILYCRVAAERVYISGYAKKYMEGEILLNEVFTDDESSR